MNLSTLPEEEKQFLRRLDDLSDRGGVQPVFTRFLNERQILLAMEYIRQNGCKGYHFEGGYSEAVRRVLGLFPPQWPPDAARFPVCAVTVRYARDEKPSHRDFLGAMMNLKVSRDSIGDILPDYGRCCVFVTREAESVMLQELRQVGRLNVRCERGLDDAIRTETEYETLRVTLASIRMDCLVGALCHLSREKSVGMIRSEQVQQNYLPAASVSSGFSEGDTVSIRGYGKYRIEQIGAPTRKGRIPVVCSKYR